MVHIETINSEVPFGRAISVELRLHDRSLAHLPMKGRIEQRYLAWETVRKKTNPYFAEGTGFEGYLVGICPDAEAALKAIVDSGQHILDAIARLYRFRGSFQTRLMRTLVRETSDQEAIHIWSAYLGAELGRLRVNVPRNKAATLFQTQTYRIVAALPAISYRQTDLDVLQYYTVGCVENLTTGTILSSTRLAVSPEMLPARQQDAWLVAQFIGEFGHPLVREFLDHY